MNINYSQHIDGMDYVRRCGICQGEGAYEQSYTVGCGGGVIQMNGRCDFCAGVGIKMTDGKPVPASVLSQIRTRSECAGEQSVPPIGKISTYGAIDMGYEPTGEAQ
jgi:hypothetical protein